MNYLKLVTDFWRLNNTENFSCIEIALYFYLIEINNSCYWKTKFSHNNKVIEAKLRISFNTLNKNRNNLKELGLIDFTTKNGNANVTYEILSKSSIYEGSDKVDCEVNYDQTTKVSPDINKTKLKQEENNLSFFNKEEGEIFNSLISTEANSEWVESVYKTQKFKKGKLTKVLDVFISAQIAHSRKKYIDVTEYKNHFVHWCSHQVVKEKLNSFKAKKSNQGGI